jgi:two-component system OmpR family sensor kinase/two-component system sensor histidine kinase BaeS
MEPDTALRKHSLRAKWMHSLGVRLFAAFALIATLGIGTVALVAYQVTTRQFVAYVSSGRQMRALRWAGGFVDALDRLPPSERLAAWQNIEPLINSVSMQLPSGQGRGPGGGQGQGELDALEDRVLVLAPDGQVLYDTGNELNGQMLDAEQRRYSKPVVVDGQTFGSVIVARPDLSTHSALERQFLKAINRAVRWAALLAALASLIAVALLSRQLVAPLRRLTAAAEAMARGDLSQRVATPRSQDEIGELGRTFNRMASDLEAADIQRRQMTADIAHELRNPLSIIRGNIEAMIDGVYPLDSNHLEPVYEETLLLQHLIEDLRLLSLAEAGQLALTRADVDVTALLAGVADGVRAIVQERDIHLQLDVPNAQLVVEGDADRLRQAVSNLVGNAVRYTPPQGTINLRGHQADDHVQISVSDTGPGISPQDLPHVFDRFYRGDAARNRASGGSGLGLAITKALVEAHGGTIKVESKPGEGARFAIDLPKSSPR